MSKTQPLFTWAAVLLTAWGAFAFGAEFAWAYAPLLTFSVAVGALGLSAARGQIRPLLRSYGPLLSALALVFGTTVIQIVPLPPSVVAAVSPARNLVDYPKIWAKVDLREFEATGPQQPARTLSIAPSRTVLALGFFMVFAWLLIGAAAGFGAVRPTLFARSLLVIGLVAAFAEMWARPQTEHLLYGFFVPRQPLGEHSAPFINKNHTAGYLLMAASLSLGYLASCVAAGWRLVKPDWHSRLLWFGSRSASEALLSALAITTMLVAVVLTASRSGALCLAVMAGLFGLAIVRQQLTRQRTGLLLVGVAVVVAAALSVGGVGAVIDRFVTDPLDGGAAGSGRPAIWRMTLDIIRQFPVTGSGVNTYGLAALPPQMNEPTVYIEAHNDYLQLAAEGGLLVGLPILVALWLLIRTIRRQFAEAADDARTYWLRVGAVIGMITMAVQSLVDFTLQMPGAAVLFVFLAAIATHRPWLRAPRV